MAVSNGRAYKIKNTIQRTKKIANKTIDSIRSQKKIVIKVTTRHHEVTLEKLG